MIFYNDRCHGASGVQAESALTATEVPAFVGLDNRRAKITALCGRGLPVLVSE